MYARAGEVSSWPASEPRICLATSCLVGVVVGEAAELPETPTARRAMARIANRTVRCMCPPMRDEKCAPKMWRDQRIGNPPSVHDDARRPDTAMLRRVKHEINRGLPMR